MKQMLKGLLAATMLLSMGSLIKADDCCCSGSSSSGCCSSCSGCSTDCCSSSCDSCCSSDCCTAAFPLILPRSSSENAARDMVGIETLINRYEMEKLNGVFYIVPEYSQTFKPCRMASSLFGEALVNGKLTITGSRLGETAIDGTGAIKRGTKDLLADYFGLPVDFNGTVSFKPKIQNFVMDLGLYLGLDELWEGGFFRIHAPIHWTKWRLCPSETVTKGGAFGYDAGYMSNAAIAFSDTNFYTSWIDAMSADDNTWGDMTEAMQYGRISKCALTKTRLADIQIALGWNFLQDEDYHFGLMLRGAFPTGNRPCSKYLFEPIAGNGRHWELGAGLTSHACLWRSEDEESMFNIYIDANVTHLFKDKQTRSFDFKDNPLSRYMLIEQLGTPVTIYAGPAQAGNPQPSAQYQSKLFPAINKTTCCTDVSIDAQGDLAIKFAYITGGWDFDLGYNLWGRTGEKFSGSCCSDTCVPAKTYALKGDAFIYGFQHAAHGAYALSATESKATIYAGTNTPSSAAFTTANIANPTIDNAALAWWAADGSAANNALDTTLAGGTQQHTSSTPKYVDDLNTCKGPSALSNKVFANVGYAWKDKEEGEWVPFVGIGGEAEFGSKCSGNYSSVSQWGVWVKGGLAFN
jgi:hypothetical protein